MLVWSPHQYSAYNSWIPSRPYTCFLVNLQEGAYRGNRSVIYLVAHNFFLNIQMKAEEQYGLNGFVYVGWVHCKYCSSIPLWTYSFLSYSGGKYEAAPGVQIQQPPPNVSRMIIALRKVNFDTHTPFAQYGATSWSTISTTLCFSFQSWHSEHGLPCG